MNLRFILVLVALVNGLTLGSVQVCSAKDASKRDTLKKQPTLFLGSKITPYSKHYLVKTVVNVRKKPKTKGKKLGTLKKLEIVTGVGEALGGWVAVIKNGKEHGFVYKKGLLHIIDGTLKAKMSGTLSIKGRPSCSYIVSFAGKTPAEGQIFMMADYGVDWLCVQKASQEGNGKKMLRQTKRLIKKENLKVKKSKSLKGQFNKVSKVEFHTPMFFSEGAIGLDKKYYHQITIDILDHNNALEDVFSTTMFYDAKKKQVGLYSIGKDKKILDPSQVVADIRTLEGVLRAALEMAYRSWGKERWSDLLVISN